MELYNGVKLDDNLPLGAKNFIKGATNRHKQFSCDTITIDEASYGCVKMSVEVTPQTTNPYGMIHGGVLFMLADSVAGLTGISLGKKVVTHSSNIFFIKSTRSGYVHAQPRIIHNGRSTILLEVDMTDDDGTLICKATFTMFVIGDMSEYEGENE